MTRRLFLVPILILLAYVFKYCAEVYLPYDFRRIQVGRASNERK